MVDYTPPAHLRAAHRLTRNKRHAERSKAVILLGCGWSGEDVTADLLVDPNKVRNHSKRHRECGDTGLFEAHERGSDQVLLAHAHAACIYIICDNPRYDRPKAVRDS